MKKIISIFLTALIIFSLTFPSLASYQAEEQKIPFSLENYTWHDIMTMSNKEFRELLTEFEKTYDPFGTYASNRSLMQEYNQVQPMWASGEADATETGSHELITARACGILLKDQGFWGENHNASLVVALSVSLASIIPDKNLFLGPLSGYAGHFYDPDTGENYLGDNVNTAQRNMCSSYNAAKAEYQRAGMSEDFFEEVGKMLHYLQDACEPHHAGNVTAVEFWKGHSAFETYADENLNLYIDSLQTIPSGSYLTSRQTTKENMIYVSAKEAKMLLPLVNNIEDKSQWNKVANETTRNAVVQSALMLYRFSIEAGIPLVRS